MTVRLTKVAKRAGCAAKHPPGYLLPLLARIPPVTDPNVIVGTSTSDDAAVYRLRDDLALVLTTDFFTPIVDEPYDFGAVAEANALSDVYAMGGKPTTALNLVGFPETELEAEVLAEILRGGAEKCKEAGIDIVGGHTIKTDEPIYGLAVTGTIHPDRVVSNAGAKAGDVLVLTKPLGIGIITTAAKNDKDDEGAIKEAIRVMSTLNRGACEAMLEVGVHAATDITGFGLLGHLRNIVAASHVAAVVDYDKCPFIEAARKYVREGIVPGGTHANRRFLKEWVDFGALDDAGQLLLSDAQTSGGMLMAVEEAKAEQLVRTCKERGTPCAVVIGRLEEGPSKIRVV